MVLSPGSRNAPLTISFDQHVEIECISVPDERSAGFFAVGMAMATREPVAICCTSGSASLNYAPAIAEAYYQRIPLLVLTADRPVEWIDQGDGQTIVQRDVYKNFIRGSFEIPQETEHPDEVWSSGRIVNEAIDRCRFPVAGPVHINIPLRESLYGQSDQAQNPKHISNTIGNRMLDDSQLDALAENWNGHSKVLILCGQMVPNDRLQKALEILSDHPSVAILTETTANLSHHQFNSCIDRLISGFSEEDKANFRPTLLVTVGHAIVSKKVKAYLREYKPDEHWHVSEFDSHLDTFQSLTKSVICKPHQFFHGIKERIVSTSSGYKTLWKGRDLSMESKHLDFLDNAPFGDLKAYHTILDFIPDNSILHMANSTAVRYVQLFNQIKTMEYYANRGTSGIDGSTSTAAGMASIADKITTLVTGDMSFFYDSNAFWNNHLTGNFRVIILNNGGGGIFRIIPGPDTTGQLEKYFETEQNMTAEHIAKQFNLNYSCASDNETLESILANFFLPTDNNRPSILEIFTPKLENGTILRSYFDHLS